MTVTKRASQRLKNYVDTTSVLQEKPQKPKETGRKVDRRDETRARSPRTWGARPWGLGQWPSPHSQNVRGSASRPPMARDPLRGPRLAPFYDSSRHFAQFGQSNDL